MLKKNLIFLVSGTTGAQLLAFLALPFITGIYSPDSFGIFAYYSSIIWGIVVVGTFQFEHLIIKVKNKYDALNCILNIMNLNIIFVAIFIIILLIYKNNINENINLILFCLLSITFLTISNVQLFRAYLIKLSMFKEVTYSNIIFTILNVILVIAIPLIIDKNNFVILLIAQLIAYLFSLFYILRKINFKEYNHKYSVDILFKEKMEILILVKSNFTKTFNSRFLILIIEKYFDEKTVGLYAMSERLISAPLTILGQSINLVHRPRYEELINNEKLIEIKKTFYKSMFINFAIGIPVAIVVSFLSNDIASIFLNSEWSNISDVISLMIFFELFNFILLTVEDVSIFLNKNRQRFFSHLLFFMTLIVMYYVGVYSLINVFVILSIVKILMIIIEILILENGIKIYVK